jgi:immunoglobulin-binding protein 1
LSFVRSFCIYTRFDRVQLFPRGWQRAEINLTNPKASGTNGTTAILASIMMGAGGGESLLERYRSGIALVESNNAGDAVDVLTSIQLEAASLFSFRHSSESLDDIATSSLPFLTLEHHLAMAYLNLPTQGIDGLPIRKQNLATSCAFWDAFFRNLECIEALTVSEVKAYHFLLDCSEDPTIDPPRCSRDDKIARHRAKQNATDQAAQLAALQARRRRLQIPDTDDLDGHDEEGLERNIALAHLEIAKHQAFEEWGSVLRELPMIERMLAANANHGSSTTSHAAPQPPTPSQQKNGLEVTRITKDALTGKLIVKKEQLRSQVFRPGWNLPTMSLDELAEREVNAALDREERQRQAESIQKPERYDQLVKKGLEDNDELVEASSALDRAWDQFKDENPRGCGNKRGDVGDRNF